MLKQTDAESLFETLNSDKWKKLLGAKEEELYKDDQNNFGLNPMKTVCQMLKDGYFSPLKTELRVLKQEMSRINRRDQLESNI